MISRQAALQRLSDERFDVVVVGGGITGAGVALDAASRGHKLTTWRRMAKLAVDRIVERDALDAPCGTQEIPLGQPVAPKTLARVPGVAADVLLRRTRLALLAAREVSRAAPLARLAAVLAAALGWDPLRERAEIARFQAVARAEGIVVTAAPATRVHAA